MGHRTRPTVDEPDVSDVAQTVSNRRSTASSPAPHRTCRVRLRGSVCAHIEHAHYDGRSVLCRVARWTRQVASLVSPPATATAAAARAARTQRTPGGCRGRRAPSIAAHPASWRHLGFMHFCCWRRVCMTAPRSHLALMPAWKPAPCWCWAQRVGPTSVAEARPTWPRYGLPARPKRLSGRGAGDPALA